MLFLVLTFVPLGALFVNSKKQSDRHPDWTGSLNVDGKDFWLSAWNKTSAKGAEYLSVSVRPKEPKPEPKPADDDEDIPF